MIDRERNILDTYINACIRNAIRLHNSSVVTFRSASYQASLVLAIVSLEEIGKAHWADDFAFHSEHNKWSLSMEFEMDSTLRAGRKRRERPYWNLVSDHLFKQWRGYIDVSREMSIGAEGYSQLKALENFKHKHLYVDMTFIDKSRIRISDAVVTKPRTRKQDCWPLYVATDALLYLSDLRFQYGQCFETSFSNRIFTKKLHNQLTDIAKELASICPTWLPPRQ